MIASAAISSTPSKMRWPMRFIELMVTEVGEVGRHSGCHRGDRRRDRRKKGVQLQAPGRGPGIELCYALQHVVLSKLACVVARNQAADELFPVIAQIALPHTTPTDPEH